MRVEVSTKYASRHWEEYYRAKAAQAIAKELMGAVDVTCRDGFSIEVKVMERSDWNQLIATALSKVHL
jgi:hypothetical protein